MKRYGEYTPTKSLWITSLPSHWGYNKLRSIFWQRKESNTPVKTKQILSLSAKNGVELYSEKTSSGGNKAKDDISKYNIAYEGDIILNCMNIISGSVGISKWYGAISPVYYALATRSEVYSKEYYYYLFRIESFQRSLLPLGRGILMHESSSGKLNTIRMRISMNDLNNEYLPLPPRAEQDQIVRYLDWKVSKINRLIHGYERQIKLLEERRKAIVTYYVCGYHTKQDRIKSEIYWLFDIPNSWKVTKLKNVLKKENRPVSPDAELLICSNKGTVTKRGDSKLGLVASSDDIYQGVKNGDLLIHGMDTWHGAIAISEFDGMCTPVVHVCTTKESKRFICYYLQMMAYTKTFKAISNGVRQNTSDFRSWDKTGAIMIPMPSLAEQENIADIIDKEAAKIDAAIPKIESQISLLREYRTRLISDVVTGQIDVRDVVIPDYIPEEDAQADGNEEESETEAMEE